MAVPKERPETRTPRASWLIMAVLTTLTALNGLWVALTPARAQSELGEQAWDQFAAAEPAFAALYAMDLVLLGIGIAAFAILGLTVALIPYRGAERWAWFALWLFPLFYGAAALIMLRLEPLVAYMEAGFAVVSLIGMLIPIRRFL